MKKKIIIIIAILIVILAVAGYFILEKINESKREYEIESISEYKFFVSRENEKFGVIDATGKTVIDAAYDRVEIPNPSKDVFICYKNEKGIAMNSGKQQIFGEYNSIEAISLKNVATNVPYEKSVLKTEKNGKFGIIDFSGKKLVDTEYDKIDSFSNIEGQLQVQKGEKQGIINIKGNVLVKPEYDNIISDNYYTEEAGYKKAGYIVGQKNQDGFKYGYIDNKGKLKLKLEYNDIERVTENIDDSEIYLIVAKNGQYGVMKNNKNIINNEYQEIEYDKTNKIFILQKNKNYGVADLSGNILISVENTSVEAKGEYTYVEKNNIREVYDATGKKVDIDFDKTIIPTSNQNYKIIVNSNEHGNYYGVIGNDNKQIIKPEYLYLEYAFDNYFIACGENGKLGVIDSKENIVLELKYDLVQKIQGKDIIQTLFKDTNLTELYSKNMKKICEMENATLDNQTDYIKVYSDKDIKYYNNNGENISSTQIFKNNNLFVASQDGNWGYTDKNGNVKVDYEYDLATELNEYGYGSVKKDGKWGCIDQNGKIVVEPKYEINDKQTKVEFIGEYIKVDNGLGNEFYTKD